MVSKAQGLGHRFGDKRILEDFSVNIMRGDKIGIIGPNGCGKTTLLRILLGQLEPQKGTVKMGSNLEISYYDQLREQLDDEKTVTQNVCGETDVVVIDGRPRHIMGYLQEFLFSPDRARTRVKMLSGGERNRLVLARLFTKTSNLLVMDEPTNDLDVETLELLEEILVGYKGTLILVSHDRTFLNNVVTSTIVIEGDGVVYEHPGGYDDWLLRRQDEALASKSVSPPNERVLKNEEGITNKASAAKKLTFKEKRELKELPELIEKLENEKKELFAQMGNPAFYKKDANSIAAAQSRLAAIEEELAAKYPRWEHLESLKGASGE